MDNQNSYYFEPLILNLSRKLPDFFDESRYKDPKDEEAIKKEAECTRQFAKNILFTKIHQIRLNNFKSILESRRCMTNVSEKRETMPGETETEIVKEQVREEVSKRTSRLSKSRRSQASKNSRKSNSAQEQIVTTTTTTTTTIFEEVAEYPSGELIKLSNSLGSVEFENDFIVEINRLRYLHGSPPLNLNRNLCNYAKDWAKVCANTNTLQHRADSNYGENLYVSQGIELTGAAVVKSWYDEIEHYNFENPGFSTNTGHFTQVIWKNSTEVGVGVSTRKLWTFVVSNYNPPGNYRGQYRENVLPKRKY